MTQDRKLHRSLRNLLRGSSPGSPTKAHSNSTVQLSDGASSHRFFLRSRDSKGSTLSLSSAESVKSAKSAKSDSEGPKLPHSDTDSTASFASKEKLKKHLESHLLLKRFFRILHLRDQGDLPKSKSATQLPALSSQLAEKYDVGRLIGTGASGSVNLVCARDDPSQIYALKKFRGRLKTEAQADYLRKVRNEFLVGEHLTHQNLIHTIELFEEKSDTAASPEYFIVMEYCPYDFFNLVMSGLMKFDEICCYFKQIVHGVRHLHDAGIAHRDLKLDNCVVDENGILKLIDFGSAFQFLKALDGGSAGPKDRMLDETHRLLYAKGVVGSDPYLAPEVFEHPADDGYDARLADVWSVAVIFCCMILKRFPWKLPRASDPSYRAFAGVNSLNEPLSQYEIMTAMTKEVNVGKEAIPKFGPDRLLRILPPHSRTLVGWMLQIDPERRALIHDIASQRFFELIDVCHYVDAEEKPVFQLGDNASATSSHGESASSPPQYEQAGAQENRTETEKEQGEKVQTEIEPVSEVPFEKKQENELDREDPTAVDLGLAVAENAKPILDKRRILVRALNHKHHLITEKDLQKLNAEKERIKRAKEAGIA